MGPTPLLKMVFNYGLRPRLWLLCEQDSSRVESLEFRFQYGVASKIYKVNRKMYLH